MQAAGDFLNVFNTEASKISMILYTWLVTKVYAAYFRYYLGRTPVVVVADPDMLRQVMVKDFSSFPNRNRFALVKKPISDCLLQLRNEQWKRVRSVLTPSFSAAKMKEMVPLINTAIDALMKNLHVYAESGEAFDIHRYFGYFAMDVIASVAFATQVDSQNNPDDPLVQHAQMFFINDTFKSVLLLFFAFPSIMAPLSRFIPNKRRDKMSHFFINSIHKIIKQREEQPPEQRRRDFLQLMLDDRTTEECVSLERFDTSNDTDEIGDNNQRPQKKMLTEDEIVGQAVIFLLAGYETSSNTLAFTCYLLALHPECQLRVQKEQEKFVSLRMWSFSFQCFSFNLKNNNLLLIPRFTPEAKASRHPFVYLPFGAGPRNCVGMKLAQLEIKLPVLKKDVCFIEGTLFFQVPLELKSLSTLGPKNGVCVKISRRSK
uniref:Thromboxane-A synthase n=1 Tax=Neolamprologus brichardi TaxID=32507 RepID=A0A3Q4HHL2_NEOBR